MLLASNICTNSNIDIIAIIGCVTGCIGLLISLLQLYRERYCLKVEFISEENTYFPAITKKKYRESPNQACIHLILRNKSMAPITIYDAYLTVCGKYTRFEKYEDKQILIPLNNATIPEHLIDATMHSYIPMDRQFELPLRLEAFDAFEGIGFIPYFPYTGNDDIKIILVLKTAKRHKHKVKVLMHLHKDL